MAQQSISLASEIGKAADTAGIGAESLQELRFALGELGNVTERQTDTALQRFNRRLGLAVDGTGAAADTFDQLGIRMRTLGGDVRETDAVLEEALVTLSEVENDALRAARASELFGEEIGPRIAASLDQGIEGMNDAREAARDLNAVIDEELIDSAERFDDWLNRISIRLRGGFTEAVLEAAQNVERLRNALAPVEQGSAADLSGRLDADLGLLSRRLQERAAGLPVTERELLSLRARIVGNATDLFDPGPIQLDPLRNEATPLDPLPQSLTPSIAPRIPGSLDFEALDAARRQRQAREFAARNFGGSAGPDPLVDLPEITAEAAQNYRRIADEAENAGESTRRLDRFAADFGFTMSSAFEDAVLAGEDLRGVVQGLLEDIAALTLRQTVTNPLADSLTAGIGALFGGTSGIGSLIGSKLASSADGNVFSGPSITSIAERGQPEAVFPLTRVGGQLGIQATGGGGDVHIHNEGAPVQVERRQRIGNDLHIWIREEMKKTFASGEMDGAMAGNYGIRRKGYR